jgi:hypothetical protein
MQLTNHPGKHLTYCTNIHPGERWNEVFEQLEKAVPELKRRISPAAPFGIGLRLSAQAASTLLEGNRLNSFKQWLQDEQLYVFTMNGFPYGAFHGESVKESVYAPDWRTKERVDYTLDLVEILTDLLPQEMDGGISTSPLSYKYWLNDISVEEEMFRQGSRNMARIAYEMARLEVEKGRVLHLDIEPEPDCLLENSEEIVDFFQKWLLPAGSAYLSKKFGLSTEEGEAILRKHIRVCYDTCHFAVEYEDPRNALNRLTEAGIRIGKVQISAALKIKFASYQRLKEASAQLNAFEESTYLHQVIERRKDETFYHYRDLPEALEQINETKAAEWRIHYHVPVFVDGFDGLRSTQDDIIQSWKLLKKMEDCHHFELETYTWEVLPKRMKKNLIDSIEREYRWAMTLMNEPIEEIKELN